MIDIALLAKQTAEIEWFSPVTRFDVERQRLLRAYQAALPEWGERIAVREAWATADALISLCALHDFGRE